MVYKGLTAYINRYLVVVLVVVLLGCALAGVKKVSAQEGSLEQGEININFVDVDISTLIKFISDVTGKNFVYDEKVRGKVTVLAPTKLSIDETFSLFTSILEIKGYTLISTETAYKIIPAAMAKQAGTDIVEVSEKRLDELYIIRLIPLHFVSTKDTISFLRPLISRNGYIAAFDPRNALLVVDTALNIDKILKILEAVDKEVESVAPEIIYLKYADTVAVSNVLNQMIGQFKLKGPQSKTPASASSFKSGGGQGGVVKVIPDTRLNAVIIVGAFEQREEYKRFIALLDIPSPATSSHINVHYLENADAEKLAKVLKGVIKTTTTPQKGGLKRAGSPTEFRDRISITPDKATNSLVIIASPADYQSLVQVINKLDRRPKQVFVEAMIMEVTIDKALELGTKWRAAAVTDGKPVAIGGVGTIDSSAMQSIISGVSGLAIGGMSKFLTIPVTTPDGSTVNLTAPGFAALFSLSEFEDMVNVLSTPHILTSNNQEAEIMVGENVPFLSKLEREATTTNQPLIQSIERKDVGITLNITPQISEGGYVRLDIYQEISAVATSAVEAADIILTKRSAKTSVVVRDNQTVVIGGLIQEREVKNTNKAPFFGDIPLLGWLFKFNVRQKQKINLLIFLTPHIIEEFEELDVLRERKEDEYMREQEEVEERDKLNEDWGYEGGK